MLPASQQQARSKGILGSSLIVRTIAISDKMGINFILN